MKHVSETVMTLGYSDWVFLNNQYDKTQIKWISDLDDPWLLGWFKPDEQWIMCRLPEEPMMPRES